jgi:FixJ family two-component response regulator
MNDAPRAKQVVHLVDDDESLRRALTRLLRAEGFEVCGYASAGEFALARSEALAGCVLLDVRMPGPSGLDLQAAIARSQNPLPVIFMTGHGDIPMSVRAMKAGAVDFLTKPIERTELISAVKAALSMEAETRSARQRSQNWRARYESLTPRERDIFARVTEGQPNKQIATETDSAERTVKAHRARVMEKMGANSLAELVHISDALGVNNRSDAPAH